MTKIDLEFSDLCEIGGDGPMVDDGPDLFEKTLADVAHGIDRASLDESLADVHEKLNSHYAKLAAAVTAPAEDSELQKIARRLAPQAENTRIEIGICSDGGRVEKTFGPGGDLVRVRILEEGEE